MGEDVYPKQGAMFAGAAHELDDFELLREEFLLSFGYNTARAYWADLDDLLLGSRRRNKRILELTSADMTQYFALLRRRHFSPNTIRRRRTSFRGFFALVVAKGTRTESPV